MSFRPTKTPQGASTNPEDIAKRRWHATRCHWTTTGRRCYLTGTMSPDTGGVTGTDGIVTGPKAFCPYHFDRIGGLGGHDDRDFTDWLEQHVTAFPGASEFTTHGVDHLWAAACGNVPLARVEQHHVEPELRRPATQGQRATAFAKMRALLNGKFAP